MTAAEARAFIEDPVRPALLATVRRDGRPHLAPIWIDLDDEGCVVFTTGADTVKGRAIRAEPRVAICVDDDQPPFSYVLIEGTAEVSADLEQMLVWATRIGGRYMGADRAEEFGRRNAVETELLVRVTPTRIISRTNVSD
ncbi:MAG TPA: PPOX class F420-dependent oxidoreductase [Acidimicrobiales bacterium]|nr:PPOX class F420-dependent oxidoreductase [Acidimicrobiales bacterium]